MASFTKIESDGRLKEMISSVFDMELSVEGGWGYSEEEATQIVDNDLPLPQLEHTLASMRAHLEMSLMPNKEERYGSINLNETSREEYKNGLGTFHKITYSITAMKESDYNRFIEEYKEGYGNDDFDLDAHFRKRKEATLTRREVYWFKLA